MARRRKAKSKPPAALLDISQMQTFNVPSGQIRTGQIPLSEVLPMLDQLKPEPRLGCPWDEAEIKRRWDESLISGHLQIGLKCRHCALEFILLTLRTEAEIVQAYQPGAEGNCAALTCPECGQKGIILFLGYKRVPGIIANVSGQLTGHFTDVPGSAAGIDSPNTR